MEDKRGVHSVYGKSHTIREGRQGTSVKTDLSKEVGRGGKKLSGKKHTVDEAN